MKKIALIAFSSDLMPFSHVILNALDMHKRGWEVKVVIEGPATKHLIALNEPNSPFAVIYADLKSKGLIDCVCKGCANITKSLDSAIKQRLNVCGEMIGHPSIARYMEAGYEIITM